MPIYEYACQGCKKVFEELIVRRADETELSCPTCGSRTVTRQLSRPAATTKGGAGSAGGACGPVG
jgi:putative FmdB family regulatory protein